MTSDLIVRVQELAAEHDLVSAVCEQCDGRGKQWRANMQLGQEQGELIVCECEGYGKVWYRRAETHHYARQRGLGSGLLTASDVVGVFGNKDDA